MTAIATLTLNPTIDGSSEAEIVRHTPKILTSIAETTIENLSQFESTGSAAYPVSVEMLA